MTHRVVANSGVALLTTSDSAPNYGDGLCVLSAILFGFHKWRSESSTLRFKDNTQELVAVQLGTLALAANIFELPNVLPMLSKPPGTSLFFSSGHLCQPRAMH